jgi:collagenase-like PrtC family protease
MTAAYSEYFFRVTPAERQRAWIKQRQRWISTQTREVRKRRAAINRALKKSEGSSKALRQELEMLAQYEAQHLGIRHYEVPRKRATNRNDVPREVPCEFLPVNEQGYPFVPLASYIVEQAICEKYMFDHFVTALAKLVRVNRVTRWRNEGAYAEVENMARRHPSLRRAINRVNCGDIKSGAPTADEEKVLDNWYRRKDFDHPLCMLSIRRAWETLGDSTGVKNVDALRRILRKYGLRPLTK